MEDREILQKLIDIISDDILKGGTTFKVNELLKTIELKRKLAPADDNEQKFWKMIGDVREKGIPEGKAHPGSANNTRAPEESLTDKAERNEE